MVIIKNQYRQFEKDTNKLFIWKSFHKKINVDDLKKIQSDYLYDH